MTAAVALTAGVGMVALASRLRRLRRELNRGLHELRRPLQVLALRTGEAPPRQGTAAGGELEMALEALGEIDAVVNRRRWRSPAALIDARVAAEQAVARWESVARRTGTSVSLDPASRPALLVASATRLAAALDNLIANALEHGGGRVAVAVGGSGDAVRFEVRDGGGARVRSRRHDPRRGHGLELVERFAGVHGGASALRVRERGTVASIELPAASG